MHGIIYYTLSVMESQFTMKYVSLFSSIMTHFSIVVEEKNIRIKLFLAICRLTLEIQKQRKAKNKKR